MKIRMGRRTDINDLVRVELSSGYHTRFIDFKPLLEELFRNKAVLFCAVDKQNIIGYISVCNNVIDFLAVTKEYQRRGIATALLGRVFSFAKLHNIKRLILEVRQDNIKAQRLYYNNGFIKKKSFVKKMNGGPITKIEFQKDI